MNIQPDPEELKQLRLAALREEIAIGSEEADRGEFVDGDEVFEEIRSRSAQRQRHLAAKPSRNTWPSKDEVLRNGVVLINPSIAIRSGDRAPGLCELRRD